jgi:hypothetical protein
MFTEICRRLISRQNKHVEFIRHQTMNSEDLAENNVSPFIKGKAIPVTGREGP